MSDEQEFQEFPMTMAHPHYAPAKLIPIEGTERRAPNGYIISQDVRGIPERYSPITVRNADEIEYYKAQGYEVVGKSDPAAYVRALAAPEVMAYVPERYPMWVNGVLVKTKDEEESALSGSADMELDEPHQDYVQTGSPMLDELAELRASNARLMVRLEAQDAAKPSAKPRGRPGRKPRLERPPAAV